MTDTVIFVSIVAVVFSVICVLLLALRLGDKGQRPSSSPNTEHIRPAWSRRLPFQNSEPVLSGSDESRAVTMRPEYLKPEPRTVRDLSIGETGYISWISVSVNQQGRAYVAMQEQLEDAPSMLRAKIRREPEGVVVILPEGFESRFRYTRRPLFHSITYLPVIELLTEPGPDHLSGPD